MVALLARILLALLLVPAVVSNTAAAEYSENDTAADPPGVLRSLLVGGDRDYPPYEFLDKNGKPAGFNVDLTRAVAETMGMQVEFRLGGWSSELAALKRRDLDILQGMTSSEDRSKYLDFVPHTIVNHAIFARKDTPPVSSLDELAGKKVIVHRAGYMNEVLADKGFAQDLILTDTPADGLRLLASGQGEYAVVAVLPG